MPPPPAEGLMSTGNPTSSAPAMSSGSVSPGREIPGTVGTSRLDTAALAEILSPISLMDDAAGPMNSTPADSHAAENSAFSERNP